MATIDRVVPFSPRDVAHFNKLRNALVNVLGIADDTQAFIQVAQALFGSGLAGVTKDGSNNMLFADPVAGAKSLSSMGGAAVAAAPGYLGLPVTDRGSAGLGATNAILLVPIVLNAAVTLTDMQIAVSGTTADNMQLGVYDATGNLLKKTAVVVNNVSGLRTIALATSLALVSGRFWLALTCSGSGACWEGWDQVRDFCKRITRASWAELPDSVTIPATVYGTIVPSIQAVVSGGLY